MILLLVKSGHNININLALCGKLQKQSLTEDQKNICSLLYLCAYFPKCKLF